MWLSQLWILIKHVSCIVPLVATLSRLNSTCQPSVSIQGKTLGPRQPSHSYTWFSVLSDGFNVLYIISRPRKGKKLTMQSKQKLLPKCPSIKYWFSSYQRFKVGHQFAKKSFSFIFFKVVATLPKNKAIMQFLNKTFIKVH